MQNLGGILCPICLNYYLKPVTASCSHSFCQLCLDEYFLHFDQCPICDQKIRSQKVYRANSLSNFVQNFIQTEHKDLLEQYKNREQALLQLKQSKILKQFASGQKIDIRDNHYIWRQGRIIRVISRVGENCKFIKVQYLDNQKKGNNQSQGNGGNNDREEELKVNSERLANYGVYTSRTDIPKQRATYKQKGIQRQIKSKQINA